MPLLILQVPAAELEAYAAAGWQPWPAEAPVRRAIAGQDEALVALQVPPVLRHEQLMAIFGQPLRGLAAARGLRA